MISPEQDPRQPKIEGFDDGLFDGGNNDLAGNRHVKEVLVLLNENLLATPFSVILTLLQWWLLTGI